MSKSTVQGQPEAEVILPGDTPGPETPAPEPAAAEEPEPTSPADEAEEPEPTSPADEAQTAEDATAEDATAEDAAAENAAAEDNVVPLDPTGEDSAEEPPEDPRVVALTEELSTLRSTQAELQSRLRAVSAAYQKQQDDVKAARDRLERQAAIKEEMRRGEVVATLFDPVQNLRRSLDAIHKGASTEDTATGLELVVQQFLDAFNRLGLEEVPGTGSRFDPNLHEALSLVPVTDPALDNVVLEVFSAGYRIGNRLIEPARVIVGQLPEPVEETPEVDATDDSATDDAATDDAEQRAEDEIIDVSATENAVAEDAVAEDAVAEDAVAEDAVAEDAVAEAAVAEDAADQGMEE